MFNIKCLFVTILSASTVVTLAHECQNLEVLVLYEALCPFSVGFMEHQLGPSYDELKDFINIKLVPFGHANSQKKGKTFKCQHGDKECKANLLQSCVMAQTVCQTPQVKFVVCQMTAKDRLNIKKCAKCAGLSKDIDECMNTRAGTDLQLEAEKITKYHAPAYVPAIIYNNVFDQELYDASVKNFRKVVCDLLQKRGDIPDNSTVCS